MKTTKEEALEQTKKAFGFVPNLMEAIADGNPALGARGRRERASSMNSGSTRMRSGAVWPA